MNVFILIYALAFFELNYSKNITAKITSQTPDLMNHTEHNPVIEYEKRNVNTSVISKIECRNTYAHKTFTGTVQHTALGFPCEYWVNVNHTIFKDEDFPGRSMHAAQNFCRNPSKDRKGIWCYFKYNGIQYRDYCNTPPCDKVVSGNSCKKTRRGQGIGYTGDISHTIHGYACRSWSNQTNLPGRYDYEFADNDVYAAENYCRNPDNYSAPWCYTTQPGLIWDTCNIPLCDVTYELNNIYTSYHAHKTEYKITKSLVAADNTRLVFPPMMIIFGTVSNIMSIKVFLRPSLINLNMSFLMRVLAVVDMLSLNNGAWNNWIYVLTGFYIGSGSDVGCKIWAYFMDIVGSYAGWVLCLITLERIIALALPLRVAEICNRKNTVIVLSAILGIISTIYISGLFSIVVRIEFVFNEKQTSFQLRYNCSISDSTSDKLYKWLSLMINSLLPFITLLFSNIFILFLFNQTLRNRREMGVTSDPGQLIFLTRMLLTTSFMYLILTIPNAVYRVTANNILYLYRSYDEYHGAMQLWHAISQCLLYINHSVNFFLFCISGKKFRYEFIEMTSCINCFIDNF